MSELDGQVGIVIIGRNEAPRLGTCFDALAHLSRPSVYVDSGSTDGSPAVAERRGVPVILLADGPYTAARGRQTGLEHLCARHPGLQYVQFVDGDCALEADWVPRAARFLDDNPRVAVVVGRLRERRAAGSLLIRLVDADWDLPTGEIDAIGGISLARLDALQEVGGWRTALISGEELDLGVRLRAAGWKLQRLPIDMTEHDIGIRTLTELWRRSVRSGYTYAILAALHGRVVPRWRRRVASYLLYGAALPLLLLGGVLWWPLAAVALTLDLTLVARVARVRMRRGDKPGFALLYALVLLLEKFAGLVGTAKYVHERLSGRTTRLMEYKSAAVAAEA